MEQNIHYINNDNYVYNHIKNNFIQKNIAQDT